MKNCLTLKTTKAWTQQRRLVFNKIYLFVLSTCNGKLIIIGYAVQIHQCFECFLSANCPDLVTPLNGQLEYNTENNGFASYSCDPGYSLQGLFIRICNDPVWSDSAPTCVTVGEYRIQETYHVTLYSFQCNLFLFLLRQH